MEKALCGPCALKGELNLETRIHLANSRKLDVEYVCPDCGSTHSWTYKRAGEAATERPEIIETAEIVEIPAVKEVYVQTRLF
ncbi:hypothetical protein ACDZ28_00045 (plasmid) [Paenibacillus sp. RS8]|uniref:hypothetical protein n=1 Tax=Paenibacillus sp. RS8 TaxID=3242681 RepID=UPI0035C0E6A4